MSKSIIETPLLYYLSTKNGEKKNNGKIHEKVLLNSRTYKVIRQIEKPVEGMLSKHFRWFLDDT